MIPTWAWWIVGAVAYSAGASFTGWLIGRYDLFDHDTDRDIGFWPACFGWPIGLIWAFARVAMKHGEKTRKQIAASEKFKPGVPVVEDK